MQRHGNRAPSQIFNHLVADRYQYLNFDPNDPMSLHGSALIQLQNLTEFFVRPRYDHLMYFYVQHLDLVNETIVVQTTNKSRTHDTALY